MNKTKSKMLGSMHERMEYVLQALLADSERRPSDHDLWNGIHDLKTMVDRAPDISRKQMNANTIKMRKLYEKNCAKVL